MTNIFLLLGRCVNAAPSSSKSHVFDGVTLTKETAAFQLCDIYDPMLKDMIESEEDLRETCDVGITMSTAALPPHLL